MPLIEDGHSTDPDTGILTLPVELVEQIFQQIDNLQDTICLSLASTSFLRLGHKYIGKEMKDSLGRWAGGRLVWITDMGTRVHDVHFPAGILTGAEMTELLRFPGRAKVHKEELRAELRVGDWIKQKFRRVDPISRPKFYWSSSGSRLKGFDGTMFTKLATPQYRMTGCEHHCWVLCNESKREYIRAAALAEVDRKSPGAKENSGLALYVMNFIPWKPDYQPVTFEDPHRGPWAGDRFRITTLDDIAGLEENKWKDITDEAVETLYGIRRDMIDMQAVHLM
ncbi:hypothetical protein EW026_g6006 [Hermanssonia centrifuga]|uniref:F-box domain-containing protein n=1 Tax=Hermanssonia centrifuga TaxID=98765 RepID=A0A4S4KCB5_9APHY|nr:hypothetical protein EW026_g6006 [Hermanssonia centrifuga]